MQQAGDKADAAIKAFDKIRLPKSELDRYPKESLVINIFDEAFKKNPNNAYIEIDDTIDIDSDHCAQIKFCAGATYSPTDNRTLYIIAVCKRNPIRAYAEHFRDSGIIGGDNHEKSITEINDPEFSKQRWWPYLITDADGIPGNDVQLAIDTAKRLIYRDIKPTQRMRVLEDQAGFLRHIKATGGHPAVPPPWFIEKRIISTGSKGILSRLLGKKTP